MRSDSASLPRVLLIGDSISMGYTKPVTELLKGRAVVTRNRGNAAHTANGLARMDEWLAAAGGNWDVIHFNFGLHDLKRVHPVTRKNSNDPNHPQQSPPATYEQQLRAIVLSLRATGAELVFASTTPVSSM